MQFYQEYVQDDTKAIHDLLAGQSTALLITHDEGGIHVGVFNPVMTGDAFYLHLHKDDEQVKDLRRKPEALLVFHDVLATIPSYWVDKNYGGAATQYYRYAEFHVAVDIVDSHAAMREPLQDLLDRFQPEKGYANLDPATKLYKGSFDEIVVLRLTRMGMRTKWKLGQNREVKKRLAIAEHLRDRNLGADAKTADLVEKTCC